jgi:hypothetical protein
MTETRKPSTRRGFLTLGAVGASAALSGCLVLPPRPPFGYHTSSPSYPQQGYPSAGAGDYAVAAPPPAQTEVVVAAPGPGYIWVGGYWGWGGHRHHWVPGRWIIGRHGHTYHQPRWHHHGRGWRLAPGHWQRG